MEDISAVCLPAHSVLVRKQVGAGVPQNRAKPTASTDSISMHCLRHKHRLSHVGHVGCKWVLIYFSIRQDFFQKSWCSNLKMCGVTGGKRCGLE